MQKQVIIDQILCLCLCRRMDTENCFRRLIAVKDVLQRFFAFGTHSH